MKKSILMILLIFPLWLNASAPELCQIFKQHPDWLPAAKQAEKQWQVPIATMMAIIHQESHFKKNASPQTSGLFQWIPWVGKTNAFGYAQATNTSWHWYCQSRGRLHADRSRFSDAIDFVGWYIDISHRKLKIEKSNTYALYLSYHEGLKGYELKHYQKKLWLKQVAKKVARQAQNYKKQLKYCN